MTSNTRLSAAFLLFLFLSAALFFTFFRSSDAAVPPAWGRSFATSAQGDTIAVPVSWQASCDENGCADAYRVTWGVEYMAVSLPAVVADDGADLLTDATMNNVVREVTVTGLADTARVPSPPILNPATVCVYVVAIRRGVSSGVSYACRTIEAPDEAPPAVEGIQFDSMSIDTTASLVDSLDGERLRIVYGLYEYFTTVDSLTGMASLDSAPENDGRLLRARRSAYLSVGSFMQMCGTVSHKTTGQTYVLIPGQLPYTQAQVGLYQERCSAAVAARMFVPRRLQAFYLTPEFSFSVSDTNIISNGAA